MESLQMLKLQEADCLARQETAFIRSRTVTWEAPVTNQYYLEYSYNRRDWFALNGGNAILLPQDVLPLTGELHSHDQIGRAHV